jgi:hypothetical protein
VDIRNICPLVNKMFNQSSERKKIVNILVDSDQQINDIIRGIYIAGIKEGVSRTFREIEQQRGAPFYGSLAEKIYRDIEK